MNERSIFAAALDIADTAERAAYLDKACGGDVALRQHLDELLAAQAKLGSFLARPPHGPSRTADYEPTEVPGTVIAGRYKLLEEIGEGGMGTVWVAEQTAPVRRKVALKLVKPGLDSRSVLARFEAERQALALMDHPNIAKVLDGGMTETGRPFFAMEYVKGVPITEYCDATRLSVSERLQLFVQVCQAVQHAHQKGIIHRDLKPSNILVAPYDDKPVPKVIDFGLAKAMYQSLTERTLHTAHETVLGTPLYMSPEQAQLNNLDVDTRSDIYSLGVLLYELLTGTTPVEKKRFKEAAWDEVRRIIREEEPPRPSTRLSSTHTLPSLAASRQTEPAKLTRLIRGELDWVVMKALEKDRTRRYETANGFAMDIQRYLTGEAVLAVPPSAGYRLRKFARRHRGALAAATVLTVALLLALGTAAASIGYVARDRTARQAETERERVARQAKTEAEVEEALREADFFRQQKRWPDALGAAHKADAILKSGDGSSAIQEQVREVVADLEVINGLEDILLRKTTSQGNQAELEQSDADYVAAFHRYGIDVDALGVDEAARRIRARPIQVELAAALDDWAVSRKVRWGDDNPGLKHLRAVVRAADPDLWRNRVRDAIYSPVKDRKTLLVKLAEEVPVEELRPVTMILLGYALNANSAYEQAASLLGKAQRLHPDNFWINHDLGWSLQRINRLEESLRYYTAALALRPRNSVIRINRATALVKQGAVNEGLAAYHDAAQLGLLDGRCLGDLGLALAAKGELDEAISAYREAFRLMPDYALARTHLVSALRRKGVSDELIAFYREDVRRQPASFQVRTNLANALQQKGVLDEAITEYRAAILLSPNYPPARTGLVNALRQKGATDELIALYRENVNRQPNNPLARINLADALQQKGVLDEATTEYREAIRLYRENVSRQPTNPQVRINLANALQQKGVLDEAIAEYREAIRLYRDTLGRQPNNALINNNLAWLLVTCPNPASHDPGQAVQLARKATELASQNGRYWNTLGVAQYRAGDYKAAIAALDKAMQLSQGGDSENGFFLAMAHWHLGEKDKAREWYDRAVQWMDQNKPQDDELRRFRVEAAELLKVPGTR